MHHERSSYGQLDRQPRAGELAHRLASSLPRSTLSLASVLVALVIFRILLVDDLSSSLGKMVGDEAGYYFGVARNILLGYGHSFDRVDPTNGVNALYTMLLVAAYRTFLPASMPIEGCYRVGVGISFVLLLAASWLFARLLGGLMERSEAQIGLIRWPGYQGQQNTPANPATANTPGSLKFLRRSALFMFLGLYSFKQVHGGDYMLALLLILAYAWYILRHGVLAGDRGSAITSGLLLGLTVLARVDSLCFVGSTYSVLMILAGRVPGSAKWVLVSLAATAAVVLPYLGAGMFEFGSWLPVSALLRTSFPLPDFPSSLGVLWLKLSNFDKLSFSVSFILSLIFIVRLLVRPRHRIRFPADRPATALLILSAYVAARFVWMVFFTRAEAMGGYLAVSLSYNAFAFLYIWADREGSRLPERWTEWAAAAMVTVGLIGLVGGSVLWRRSVEVNLSDASQLAFARAVHDHTYPLALLYGETFGMVGFLSGRRWMNGEGIVGSIEYYRILQRGDSGELLHYLERQGVTHLVTTDRKDAELGSEVYQQRIRDGRDETVSLVQLKPGWVKRKDSLRDTNRKKQDSILRPPMVLREERGKFVKERDI